MNPRRSRRLRNTENMSGPGIGVVLRDEPAYGNARKIVEQRPHRLLHGTADVLEINVNALGSRGFEQFCKIGRAMVHTSIETQLAGDEAAFLSAAGDPDRMASFDFGDLPDYRPDGAGGRRDDDSLSRLRLTNFQKTDIRRHPRHAEHAERRRDRRRRRIEFAQTRALCKRVFLPAAIAKDDVANRVFRIARLDDLSDRAADHRLPNVSRIRI